MRPILIAAFFTLATALAWVSCHHSTPSPPPEFPLQMASTGPGNAIADLPFDELRSVLADLARAHDQKAQLAWYVNTPILRSVNPAIKPFYQNMGKVHKELYGEITAWAKAHNIDLTYRFSNDTAGRAQKMMEDRQEKLVRGDDKQDFERDNLMQMYNDYEWQLAEIRALLPHVRDPALKAYLEKSLKAHESGSGEIVALLKRFKFS